MHEGNNRFCLFSSKITYYGRAVVNFIMKTALFSHVCRKVCVGEIVFEENR